MVAMNIHPVKCIVLTLLWLRSGIEAAVPDKTAGEQWIYMYQANTFVKNNLSTNAVSQWGLSAKLIIHSFNGYKIMKLNDIKTTAYNGPLRSENLREFEINKRSEILMDPFLVYYSNNYELEHVNFSSEEPIWSMNIKKAVASLYQVDFHDVAQNDFIIEITKKELNIYGRCKVKYKNFSAGANVNITKEIQTSNCEIENSSRNTWDNINLGHYSGEILRNYFYKNSISNSPADEINSNAKFSYRIVNADRTTHEIEQQQQLKLLSTSKIETSINVSSFKNKKSPTYEFDQIYKKKEATSSKNAFKNWIKYFNQIKYQINDNDSSKFDEKTFATVKNLRESLRNMDLASFKSNLLQESNKMKNIFSSLLPYVGTDSSLDYIKEIVLNNSKIDLQELRLLAMFPLYVKNPDETSLKKMEDILDLDLKQVSEIVKQTYILSFSNLVYQTFDEKLLATNDRTSTENYYKPIAEKYVEKYYKLFTESNDYSMKMKYILGIMNIGEKASSTLMSIVKNTTECRHVRALAIYSIKPEMIYKKREAYQLFWPIVKNESEPFEIRTAALSLLLSSNINSSELYSILSYMNQTTYDAPKQHLHNYFYTAILSGKTDCQYCTIKSLAQTMVQDLQPPETNQGLLTSYHQVSYSDKDNNFETTLNVHAVANPITNFVNVFQVTLNHFTGQRKTGEYSIYIKAEGISSKLYKEEYERRYAITDLYKILQEMHLALLQDYNEDLHIEFIVYHERRAIFAIYINKDNIEEMADYIDKIIIYLGNNDIITMRDVTNSHFASDIGTPIYATLNYEHLLGTEFKNYDKIFLDADDKDEDENYVLTRIKSMWTSKLNFESHNPLTNLNHGISKIFSDQIFLKFKMDYNVYELSIKMNDETSYFDTLIDFKYAVFVDNEEVLKAYCPECAPVVFLSVQNTPLLKETNFWLWMKNITIKEENCTNPRFSKDALHEIIKRSQVSYTGLPFAQPFVLLAYIADYLYYIPQYDICSTSINTQRVVDAPNLSTLKITFINDALDENYKLNLNFNITLALVQQGIKDKRVYHQWNLNIQRQELDKGVYYELHYDDNGQSIKFDVHSDLDYVSSSPDTDMFSLKPAEPIISRTSIHLKEKDAAPTTVDITSLFSVSSEQIAMVNKSKTFQLCQKDYEKDYFRDLLKHTPPTKSCYSASLGLSTYDNYAIYIEFKNVSKSLRNTLENEVLKPLKNIGALDKTVITEATFNASVVYFAIPSMINIDVGDNHIVSNYSVPELLRPRALLKPTTKLIEELRYNVFGLDNVCIIIPKYVITFTGKIVEHDTDMPIIPLIECTNTTRIGLTTNRFTYKLWSDENTFQLGKKEGGYYVMRNGKYLKRNVRAEDYTIDLLNENTYHITTSRIELYYNGEYLTIKIKSAFINRMCGVCVTGETSTPNMMSKYFN